MADPVAPDPAQVVTNPPLLHEEVEVGVLVEVAVTVFVGAKVRVMVGVRVRFLVGVFVAALNPVTVGVEEGADEIGVAVHQSDPLLRFAAGRP